MLIGILDTYSGIGSTLDFQSPHLRPFIPIHIDNWLTRQIEKRQKPPTLTFSTCLECWTIFVSLLWFWINDINSWCCVQVRVRDQYWVQLASLSLLTLILSLLVVVVGLLTTVPVRLFLLTPNTLFFAALTTMLVEKSAWETLEGKYVCGRWFQC